MEEKNNKPTENSTNAAKYKSPVSFILCYVLGIAGLFAAAILFVRAINLQNEDAIIGGAFLGASIMLFILYYIANDLHYLSWQAEQNATRDEEYQKTVLQCLRNLEEKNNSK